MLYNGKNYELKFTGKTLLKYKEEFHKDLLYTISNENILTTDFTAILEIVWALLKTVDDELPKYEDWLSNMSLPEIATLVSTESFQEIASVIKFDKEQTKELKKK